MIVRELQVRNLLDHLPERQRPWVKAMLHRAYRGAGFRRVKGHEEMPQLVAALRARDQQLRITVSAGSVA
jgi:hypothetical protein